MAEPASGQGHVGNVAVVLDATFHNEQSAKALSKVTECAQIYTHFVEEDMAGVGTSDVPFVHGRATPRTA